MSRAQEYLSFMQATGPRVCCDWRPQVAWLLLVAFAAGGCSDDPTVGRPPLHPASCTVTVAGKPAEGITLNFHPVPSSPSQQYIPSATTDKAGAYQVGTFAPNDGAPEGEYVVTATWWNAAGDGDDAGQTDRLRGRYADHATSKLKVTVPAGGGQLPPLNLK